MFSAVLFLVPLSLTQVLCMNPYILRTNSPARMNENSVFSTQMKEKDIFNTLNKLENFYEHQKKVPQKSNIRNTEFDLLSARNNSFLRHVQGLRRNKAKLNRNLPRSLIVPDLNRKLYFNELDAKSMLRRLSTDQILDLLRSLTKLSHPDLRINTGLEIIKPHKGHAGVHLSESERSSERFDPQAPGKVHYGESSEETDLEVVKYGVYPKPGTKYSYYDFWTYKKPYIEGVCRDGEVNINGVCVQLPPH